MNTLLNKIGTNETTGENACFANLTPFHYKLYYQKNSKTFCSSDFKMVSLDIV